ncbi:succinyl-CoA synthetase-like protein [Microstroma glucosiphilum]|uniref:Succinyl-CoA synthetase-like protein n=1 Tax=Pseudomicrostroma glucosiphilum TaxID=1684307 RepID=A0A316UC74_9BASI|nr:succinyl-CoA synthetase-like protein [Pseudomicrostroma glucosiphilum]PWN20605.1 succinyl-CoA synthetase-like protein [Pseudomicrostroma glucosiphilum]
MASRSQLRRLVACHDAVRLPLGGVLPLLRSTPARPSLVSKPQRRNDRYFSLEAKAAASFLSEHIRLKQVTHDEPASKNASTLAVLLHADRRPQHRPDGSVRFGPSIQICAASDLPPSHSAGLGTGDVGIMKLQLIEPEKVQQRGIQVSDEWSQEEAEELLREVSVKAGIEVAEASRTEAASVLLELWKLFKECEGIWFTLRLDLSKEAPGVTVVRPFLEFDDFALHRLPSSLQELHKARPRDSNTAQAEDGGLFYIKLSNGGNIGSFGYGAGNAMGTMDGLTIAGGTPANFLDGGGGANRVNSRLAIETLNRDADVKTIFVNTFGGITQTDIVADGVIDAVKENGMRQPIVVRVKGTGSDEAKEKLLASGLENFHIRDDFKEAALLAVELSKSEAQE